MKGALSSRASPRDLALQRYSGPMPALKQVMEALTLWERSLSLLIRHQRVMTRLRGCQHYR